MPFQNKQFLLGKNNNNKKDFKGHRRNHRGYYKACAVAPKGIFQRDIPAFLFRRLITSFWPKQPGQISNWSIFLELQVDLTGVVTFQPMIRFTFVSKDQTWQTRSSQFLIAKEKTTTTATKKNNKKRKNSENHNSV